MAVCCQCFDVSTHSRPKAAGFPFFSDCPIPCCFNTQPPEGGWLETQETFPDLLVSTHSRPKAAGVLKIPSIGSITVFQHTAARRRLV